MHLGAEGAWLAGCVLLVGVAVCVGETEGVGPGPRSSITDLKVPMPKVVKPGAKSYARSSGKYGFSRGDKAAPGGVFEESEGGAETQTGDGDATLVKNEEDEMSGEEYTPDLKRTGPAPTDNVVVNNVALIYWTQASEVYNPNKEHLTVGALIATNAIVCTPSAKVPVLIQNTSNWNVHQIAFSNPHEVVQGKKLAVVYHPDFTMDQDLSNRITLIMLLPEAEDATRSLIPIKMVAAPFLPMLETTRHDDYSLANCIMVVANEKGDGVEHIGMTAVMCRHSKKAKKSFHDRICAYTRMTQSTAQAMVRSVAFPRDLGSPLICGNLLVGVYSGIQNTRGTYNKEAGLEANPNIPIGGKRLSNNEQYTFEIPGAPKNFEFLSAFVNEEKRKMRWEQKLNLKETSECLSNQTRTDIGGDSSSMTGPEPE